MNEFKRLLRYAQEIPANRFTEFQQGMIHGAALAGGPDAAWEWLEKALDAYDEDLQKRA